MTKTEFLDILRNSLSSELPGDKVNENINYYDGYIEQSVAKGKSYDEVFNELGDPRLIAKTITDTYKMPKGYQHQQASQGRNYENNPYHNTDYNDTYSRRDHKEHKNKGFNINIESSMPWYLKLLGILLVILAIVVIVALGGVAIHLFFSIIVPILFVYFIVKLIFNIFNH